MLMSDVPLTITPPVPAAHLLVVNQNDLVLLEKFLDRDRTAWETQGGLKGLLSLSDDDVNAFRELVARLRGALAASY